MYRTTRRARLATRLFFKPTSAFVVLVCSVVIFHVSVTRAQNPPAEQSTSKPSVFRVKYVSDGSLYIDGGRNANLQEAMKLSLVNAPPDGVVSDAVRFRGYEHVAELKIISVADSSSVCEIVSTNSEIKAGQMAFLTPDTVVERRQVVEAAEEEKYPIIMTFTYGDPLEEEVRTAQEQKQFQESPVGRVRGRVGFDYGGIHQPGGINSKQVGLSIQSDISNIGGTYWNFKGYWRGNMNLSSAPAQGATIFAPYDRNWAPFLALGAEPEHD